MKKYRIVKNLANEYSVQVRIFGLWWWSRGFTHYRCYSDGSPYCYKTKEDAQSVIDREVELVKDRERHNTWTPI